ncbi:hypothetical protein [Clostridium sp. CCUG 7971]|uniref:hypothetical protein n=1 Tax=Clostridium sp. CCUG 7971 TaxID=2811414 RepID=UPI001ABB3ADA|nr:hypothetical protein [Clostridium sp. CCUG 7971]MBO3445188.1 hypothetical protein [Clostridium sp. CCUG 7971]
MKKVLRIFIMSAVTCFSLTFALIIINAVMRIFIGIDIYFMLFVGMTIASTIGLVLYNSKKIFSKKKKVRKNRGSHKVVRQTSKHTSEVRKRKIS